jgi:AcrR family transcriptional regulator
MESPGVYNFGQLIYCIRLKINGSLEVMVRHPAQPSRFERRRLRNRAKLLEAAIELFQEQGLRATKLEEICERADVSPRTFFNHFDTREHLYRAIARERAEQMAARLASSADDPAPTAARLERMLGEIADYLEARPAYRELVGEMLSLPPDGGSEATRRGLLGRAALAFVEHGVARGEIGDRHPPEVLADVLVGVLTVALTQWCADPDFDLKHSLGQSARALIDLF